MMFDSYTLNHHKRTSSFKRHSKCEFGDLEEEPLPLPHKLPNVISSKDIRSPERENCAQTKYNKVSYQSSAHKQRSFNGYDLSENNPTKSKRQS